ncbi:MAG: hypothetical protein HY238_19295 [Acidobacteria bacterium]|nr:hypothetical protein [Acidobacteriota bacterium]
MRNIIRMAAWETVSLGLLAGLATAEPRSIVGRERRQQSRILQGVRSGALTPAETARLESQEARLGREVWRDRHDGDGLGPRERAKITRQQNRLSREIYRDKHN